MTTDQIKDLIALVQAHGVKGAAHRLQLKPIMVYQRLYRAGFNALGVPNASDQQAGLPAHPVSGDGVGE